MKSHRARPQSQNTDNGNTLQETILTIKGAPIKEPVWIDLVTGAIYQVPARMFRCKRPNYITLEGVPYYDASAVVT